MLTISHTTAGKAARTTLLAAVAYAGSVLGHAQVVIETVSVGNPGNAGEMSGYAGGGYGEDRVCGAVDYVYEMGKFEVTAAQYAEFLNAVAVEDDPHGLWNWYMWGSNHGCQIDRFASPGTYWYFVPPEWADRSVNWVSWGDAARFANWLHNGQPVGPQGPGTTEDGAYVLNGATSDTELMAIVREPDATWVIPSEDEWYKAAQHANNGATGDYFVYPTGSDIAPANDLIDPDPGNSANYYTNHETLGPPYYRSVFGDFENSPSPYGTFDQGGNVREWTEGAIFGLHRLMRGGSYLNDRTIMAASYRDNDDPPTYEDGSAGFRVAYRPPTSTSGDMNCDGALDAEDIDPFFLALGDVTAYETAFPKCEFMRADINADGGVDAEDVDPFFSCLADGGCP